MPLVSARVALIKFIFHVDTVSRLLSANYLMFRLFFVQVISAVSAHSSESRSLVAFYVVLTRPLVV